MNLKIRPLMIGFLALVLLIGSAVQASQSSVQNTYVVPNLKPAWTTGSISEDSGLAGMVAADLDQDGVVDIASCNLGYVFILNETESDQYETTWYSHYLGCLKLTAGDRDGNGVSELYLSTETGKVVVIDGKSHAVLGSFTTGGYNGKAIEVADVDGDGDQEIVITDTLATLVYDATTYAQEWLASGYGGRTMGVGNIDADPLPEIVVSEVTAYVLNASTQSVEWNYPGGFGIHMSLGNVDEDDNEEIAFIPGNDYMAVKVLDGDSQDIIFSVSNAMGYANIAVADVDEDGVSEVLTGSDQWGSINGYKVSSTTPQWSISNPGYSTSIISAGDANNDDVNEILWGSGFSFGAHGLSIGSWESQSLLWSAEDLDGPIYVAAGDVDNDGQGEFVMATYSTNYGYDGGTLRVYDSATRQVEWSVVVSDHGYDLSHLAIGQLDADPALEILVGGMSLYVTTLQAYDGASHELEWASPSDWNVGTLTALSVKNVDHDEVEEIIIGLSIARVIVLNGASNIIEFDTGDYDLDSPVIDLSVGDLDEDSDQDVAILTTQGVFVYDTDSWTETMFEGMYNGMQVAISEADLNGGAELLLLTANSETDYTLQAWDGTNYATVWTQPLKGVTAKDLVSQDVDQDGIRELVVIGAEGDLQTRRSMLWIGSKSYPSFWEFKLKGYWGILYSMALSDIDNDESAEFVFGASNLIQVNELTTKSVNLSLAYLPFTNKPCIPVPAYFDDFSDPYSGWPAYETDYYEYEYINGEYRILVIPKGYVVAVRPAFTATEYAVDVDLRNINNIKGSYGLAFAIAADWSSFFTLEIYPDGWYGVYRYYGGTWLTLAEAYSPAIRTGTASNQIKAERIRDQINVYANGQLLTTVYDNVLSGSRYVGLIVFTYEEKNLDIRFDNFTVWPIECGGEVNSITNITGDWQPVLGAQSPDFRPHGYRLERLQQPGPGE